MKLILFMVAYFFTPVLYPRIIDAKFVIVAQIYLGVGYPVETQNFASLPSHNGLAMCSAEFRSTSLLIYD